MEDAINLAMFEFALSVQSLVKKGWEFKEIDYGERRLGIGPRITVQRGEVVETIYSYHEVERLFERD
jgi:hypothetical protein